MSSWSWDWKLSRWRSPEPLGLGCGVEAPEVGVGDRVARQQAQGLALPERDLRPLQRPPSCPLAAVTDDLETTDTTAAEARQGVGVRRVRVGVGVVGAPGKK